MKGKRLRLIILLCIALVVCIIGVASGFKETHVAIERETVKITTTSTTTTTTSKPTTTTSTSIGPPTSTQKPTGALSPSTAPTAPPTTKGKKLERTAVDRVWEIYERSVPARWKARIRPNFRVIEGSTSWARSPNEIDISEYHVNSSDSYLAVIITHEYGHLIAFNYGSQAYYGAPPKGWPPRTNRPEEHWADCVQQVFLGFVEPTPGLPPCEGAQLSWARNFLAN